MEEKLIWLVEAHPCLYDKNARGYMDKIMKENVWRKIAGETGSPSWERSRRHWECLRDKYRREKKHIDSMQKSGSGQLAAKKWYLFDQMNFLAPFTSTRITNSNFEYTTILEAISRNETSDVSSFNLNTEIEADASIICEKRPSDSHLEHENDSTTFSVKKRKKEEQKKAEQTLEKIVFTVSDIAHDEADAEDLFLLSLLPEIRSLSGEDKLKFRIGVLKLLGDIKYSK